MKTLVIAEIGSAWRYGESPLQHLVNALEAIRIAKDAGASCIKFQWTSNPHKMAKRRKVKKGAYTILAWPQDWIESIYQECERLKIEFMCTVFLPEDVKVIDPFVKRFKVASLENNSEDLMHALLKTEKEIIASHGATEPDIESSKWSHAALHCTAAYPAPPESLNLLAIGQYGYEGYSDHSAQLTTGALAVACGAKIIEVHFRLSRTPKDNPDYNHSHSPERLKQYIHNIQSAEIMLGDGRKKVEKSEQWALKHKVKT